MERTFTQALTLVLSMTFAWLLVTPLASAHETDQYTLPRREFADIGPYLNAWIYDAIDGAVKRTNNRIETAQGMSKFSEAQRLQQPDEITRAVNNEIPNAMAVIEGLESKLGEKNFRAQYPGRVPGYKESFTNIYEKAHFFLDPRQMFRVWLAKTFVAYGVHLGGDKIGHFTDMGMNYWRAYESARRGGANEQEATAAAIKVGTQGLIFSEKGMLGYLSAGAYSNGDMASNYLGFVFYRNLTSPMMLKGRMHPALIELEGGYWKIAPHVQRDNDFFAVFMSDHLDEALNPSHYERGMRDKIREAIKQRQSDVLERFADENGLRRPMAWFEQATRDTFTYFGTDYGHRGAIEELNTIAATCFDPLPIDASPTDVNDRGYTPLHDAVIRGDLERISALLNSGADVNATIRSAENFSSEWGATPLHLAARDGRRDIADTLLRAGANARAADARGATALHWGCGSSEIASILASAGADPNARDVAGRSPLHWAANIGSAEGVDALAKHGSDVNAADLAGTTPLHLAARRGAARAIARLIDDGAPIEAGDRYGRTPLHKAALLADAEPAGVLLDRGANAVAKDSFGMTPLHEAARMGRELTARAMIDRGASVMMTDLAGVTPLHLAARYGHESSVTLLLARNANPNARSAASVTPLHEAAFAGRTSIVAALTHAGSDPSVRDLQGRTPRDIAQSRGHRDVLALLVAGNDHAILAEVHAM